MKNNKLQYNVIKYKGNYAILDIESFNEIDKARPYDISLAILNNKHEIIDIYCLLNKDIMLKPELQENCFYKDKLDYYFLDLKDNKDKIKFIFGNGYELCNTLNNIINDYNIKLIKGYNIDFDYKAINRYYNDINNAIRLKRKWYKELGLNYKKIPNLIHNDFKKVNCFDIMLGYTTLLQNSLTHRLGYEKFCIDNDYLSESLKNISSKEDHMYRYFINATHEEKHIGYKDVLDEIELDKKLRQFVHTRELKSSTLLLNTKVDRRVYFRNGLFEINRVKQELNNYHLI